MAGRFNIAADETISPAKTVEAAGGTSPGIIGKAMDPLALRLAQMRREGMSAKKKYTSDWQELIAFAQGTQWNEKMPRHRTKAEMNIVLGLIERKAALLTDTNPIVKVRPISESSDNPFLQQMEWCSKGLELMIKNIWTQTSAGVKMMDLFYLAEIFGTGGTNVMYNSSLGPRGQIDIGIVDPRSLIIDPAVNRWFNLEQAEYVIIEELVPTDELKLR